MNFSDSWFFLMEHRIFNINYETKIEALSSLSALLGSDTDKRGILQSRISKFDSALSIMVLDFNPETNEMELDEDKQHLNTSTSICLELGELIIGDDGVVGYSHDVDLDAWGATFEDAVIELASRVKRKFGSDTASSIFTLKSNL